MALTTESAPARCRRQLEDPSCAGVLITGDAGVGKSHLAAALVDQLATEGRTIRRIFASGADDTPLAALSRALSTDETPSGLTPVISLKRMLEAEEQPSTFLIDDVDAVDPPTLAVLIEVADAGLANLVMTVRSGSVLPHLVERSLSAGSVSRIVLAPFGPEETALVASRMAGRDLSASSVRSLHDLTQGNALYIREVVTAALDDGSTETTSEGLLSLDLTRADGLLVDSIQRRLDSIDDGDRALLERIAVAGSSSHGEIAEFTTPDRLDRLVERNLLVSRLDGRRLRFAVAHPLYGEVLSSAASTLTARRIRAQHAQRIEQLGMRRSRDRIRLATWSLDGICSLDASDIAIAAQHAYSAHDIGLSRRLAEVAFDQDPTPDSAQFLAMCMYMAGDFEAMKHHFPLWDQLAKSDAERALFSRHRANAYYWRGFDAGAVEWLTDQTGQWSDPVIAREVRASASAMLVTQGHIDSAVELADSAGDLPPGPAAASAAVAMGHGLRSQARPLAAESLVEESLAIYRQFGPDAKLLSEVVLAGVGIQALAEAGRFAEVDELVSARFEEWRDTGDTQGIAIADLAVGFSWFLRGDDAQAVRLADTAAAGFSAVRQTGMGRWATTLKALALAEPGNVDEAQRVLAELDTGREHPAQMFAAALARTRAWVDHHTGWGDRASTQLRAAVDDARALGNIAAALDCIHDLTRQRRATEAAALLETLDTSGVEGEFHLARIAHVRAAAAASSDQLAAAMARFDRLHCSHLAAACAIDAARLAANQPAETKHWMDEAAKRSARGVVAEQAALAAWPLTTREREVASLALHGLTSRQIAERLGTSRRTVDTQLGSVYTKLNTDGRVGLVELVREAGAA